MLRALAYNRVFDHPLTAPELWAFGDLSDASPQDAAKAAEGLAARGVIEGDQGYFALSGLAESLPRRLQSNARAKELMPRAMEIGRRILGLPFVRAVAISGSLSKGVMHDDSDFDFFVITAPDRLWIARTILALHPALRRRGLVCPNYIIDESALALPARDPFTALELKTMLPVGGHDVLRRFRAANAWVEPHWPNLPGPEPEDAPKPAARAPSGRRPWLGALANRALLRLTKTWLARRFNLGEELARGDYRLEPSVFKGHRRSWKRRLPAELTAVIRGAEARQGGSIAPRSDPNKVLFSHSYFYRFDPKQWRFQQPYPPLGTLYAAAVARQAGFEVGLSDSCLARSEDAFIAQVFAERPGVVVLYDDGFNYLTKMCLTRMRDAALMMIMQARLAGAQVLVSSSDAADHYDRYLDAGACAVIRGEGEETLREALLALRAGASIEHIPGLAHRRGGGGKTVLTKPRKLKRALDDLPPPAWDLVDLAPYREIWQGAHGRMSLNVATTRGCPYKCNWCAKPIYGNSYSVHSPERVVDDIAALVARFGVREFWMCDDIFGLKPNWVPRFAKLLAERGLDIAFTIQSRTDLLLREGEIEALAEAGLKTAWFGAESGSQSVLDAMDKGIERAQIDAVVPKLRAHGIRSAMFLQFGYLGETAEDIQATLDMVDSLRPDDIGASVSYPLPGTKFYDKVKAQLGAKQNWSDSDDLDMMFTGTFAPAFYKRLHRHLHHMYRLRRDWTQLTGGGAAGRPGDARQTGATGRPMWRAAASALRHVPFVLLGKADLALQARRGGAR